MARGRWVGALVIAVGLCLAAPQSALAWGAAGGNASGPGTHQWILRAANEFARQQGTVWVDYAAAASATVEPQPDSANPADHDYDHWGPWNGSAHSRVDSLYAQAVIDYRNGDREGASRAIGLLAHYYADVCDPLHTDDSPSEPAMARRFEFDVDWLLTGHPATVGWAAYDGYQRVSDPAAATVSAATKAHGSYNTLLSAYTGTGFDSSVSSIAKAGVGRAANGIADLIMSVQQDAVEVAKSPDLGAHQGVASGGGYYYVFHTDSVARYDRSWNATGTIDHPVGWWNGFIEPHLGDGCYYGGRLYVVAENYPSITNMQIIVYDAAEMSYITRFWTHQTHEVSSVTVADLGDGQPVLVVSSYTDSTRLFKYSIADGTYLGSIPLDPRPRLGVQSIASRDGLLYLAVGRGYGPGYLYTCTPTGATKLLYTRQTLGYHEGLDYDGQRLLWLVDHPAGSHVFSLEIPAFLHAL